MRFNKEDFIMMINEIDNANCVTDVAKKYNIDRSYLNTKYLSFKENGDSILVHKKHRFFTPDEKFAAVQRYYNGETKTVIARSLGVVDSVIFNWIDKYEKMGYNGLIKNSGRPKKMNDKQDKTKTINNELSLEEQIKLIEKENMILKMENEALKKLHALVQQRIKRQTRKK